MDRKEVYPIYVAITKEKCKIKIPDFAIEADFETVKTMLRAMENARAIIENTAKEYEEEGKTIPAPGSVEYKRSRGEVFTYVDVNLDKLFRKTKKLEELERLETEQINDMWDVKENVIEFFLNQKVMSVTLTQRKLINRVREYAKEYPDEVKILRENEDGSIFAKLPVSYLRLKRPSDGRIMSEEEKAACRARLEAARMKRSEQKEENQELSEAVE